MKIEYNLIKQEKNTKARLGTIKTNYGTVETPMFMPVGTKATVKGLSPEEVKETGAGIVLANTYHLWLRPGEDIVNKAGGLHKFMNYDGPILTDSGGIQEEAPTFGAPVLVMRYETERTEGVDAGFAKLVGADIDLIVTSARAVLSRPKSETRLDGSKNPYGNGQSAQKIAKAIFILPLLRYYLYFPVYGLC